MAAREKIEKLEDLIRDSIGGELVEQTVTPLLPPGENYGSVIYKVDFKVIKDGEEKEHHHAVAKCTPPNLVTQELFNTQESFKSEIAWYTTVIPTLKRFAKDQGLKRELDFFQPFYGARINLDPQSERVDLDGVILTQNLKYLGYSNIDRHVGFDLGTTRSVLRDLATFHAVPLALHLKDPALFEGSIRPYCSAIFAIPDKMKVDFDEALLDLLEFIPDLEPHMDRIRKSVRESYPFAMRKIREPWMTIQHLDFWCNNIMVTGGENSKTMILDLQVTMPGSPVGDLIFLLMTSVRLDVAQSSFDELIRYYYDEFIKNLRELQVDTNNYGFEGFLEEIDIVVREAEFSHILSHSSIIMQDKGESRLDSSDPDFTQDKIDAITVKRAPNQKQAEKLKWNALESVKRGWV